MQFEETENCMRKSKQEAGVTRQGVIKEAAGAFRKNGIAGDGSFLFDGNRSVLRKNYCTVLKPRE